MRTPFNHMLAFKPTCFCKKAIEIARLKRDQGRIRGLVALAESVLGISRHLLLG